MTKLKEEQEQNEKENAIRVATIEKYMAKTADLESTIDKLKSKANVHNSAKLSMNQVS